jgi:alanine-glyoxylate transaminase/(R)-3-amino-2-methylpropionate-pyruvate transaminase
MGKHIVDGLVRLQEKHNIVGHVRGKGLMLGIELVKDRATKEPAKAECAQILETCRDLGLLLGKGGLHGQTIRFSPPMNIHQEDAEFLIDVLDEAFCSL